MVTDLNKMEYLLNTKRCYCFNLNEKKIVKGDNITKNYGAMDLRKPYFWLVLTYSLYLYTVFDTDLHVII
jgi:alpha-glucosidase